MIKNLLYISMFTISIYSEVIKDYDMDGVPDTIDVCNYTPFFDKVDKSGCSTKRVILPEDKDNHSLDIIFDYGLSHNDDTINRENISKTQIELNYYHNSYIYSLKTGYLKSKNWSDIDDTLLGIKRHFQFSKNIRLTTGLDIKAPTYDFKGNRFDYGFSQDLNYYPIENLSLSTPPVSDQVKVSFSGLEAFIVLTAVLFSGVERSSVVMTGGSSLMSVTVICSVFSTLFPWPSSAET